MTKPPGHRSVRGPDLMAGRRCRQKLDGLRARFERVDSISHGPVNDGQVQLGYP